MVSPKTALYVPCAQESQIFQFQSQISADGLLCVVCMLTLNSYNIELAVVGTNTARRSDLPT